MNLGPIILSVDEIKTGIATVLIVFLPNLIIILLFKYAGPKVDENEKTYQFIEDSGSEGKVITLRR